MVVVSSVWRSAWVPVGRPPVAGDRGCWAKERFCHRGRRTAKSSDEPGPLAPTLSRALLDTSPWRSPATRCWRSGCTPSSSTRRARTTHDRRARCSTSACRTPGRTARAGRWSCAARTPDPDDLFTAWTLRGRAARLPPRPGGGRRRRGRSVLGGRRGQAGLRRLPAAEGGRHPGARRPRPDRRRDARHRHQAGRQGRRCPRELHRAAARALPALVPGLRRRAPLRAAVPPRRAAWRARAPARHLSPGPPADPGLARPGQAGRPDARPRARACCACSGPLTPKQVAGYLDAPVKDVKAHWPEDVVPVTSRARSGRSSSDDLDAL